MSDPIKKKNIAVLGGGAGSLSAVYYLTSQEGWQDRYDITVYQMGWRLGGKGASGRDREKNFRIEEHGVHYFFGCYENAFRLMADCYEKLNRGIDEPLSRAFPPENYDPEHPPSGAPKWAFTPRNTVTLMANTAKKPLPPVYQPWNVEFEKSPGVPGSKKEETSFITIIGRLVQGLRSIIDRFDEGAAFTTNLKPSAHESRLFETSRRPKNGAKKKPKGYFKDAVSLSPTMSIDDLREKHLIDVALGLINSIPNDRIDRKPVYKTLHSIFREYGDRLGSITDPAAIEDLEAKQFAILGKLISTVAIGFFSDRVYARGLDYLDQYEFTEWLKMHGIKEEEDHIWWSPAIRGLYEMVFGFAPEKDGQKGAIPNLSAAAALRGVVRFFGDYSGGFIWEMNSGMGDVIFVPLYTVLKRRGVKFRFFHKVESLSLNAQGDRVESIKICRQIESRCDLDDYDPLIPVPLDGKTLDAWPKQPNYDQLDSGQAEKLKKIYEDSDETKDLESSWLKWEDYNDGEPNEFDLDAGADFDEVIIGVGLGMIPRILNKNSNWPVSSNPNRTWIDLCEKLRPVRTKGIQLWMSRRPQDDDPIDPGDDPRRSSYGDKFPSWIGMTHVEKTEKWPVDEVKHIAYLFAQGEGVTDPDPDVTVDAKEAKKILEAEVDEFLKSDAAGLWGENSQVISNGELDYTVLVKSASAPARLPAFKDQYFRVNLNLSDLYVPAPPNTLELRPWPEKCGLANGYVAADWARNGFNCGCVESAVMSGMRVAREICGSPKKVYWEKRDFEIVKLPDIIVLPGPGSAASCPSEVPDRKKLRKRFLKSYRKQIKLKGKPPKGLWVFLKKVKGIDQGKKGTKELKAREKLFYKCFASLKVLEAKLWRAEMERGFKVAAAEIARGNYSTKSKIRIVFKRLLTELDRTLYESRETSPSLIKAITSYSEERKVFIKSIEPYIEMACEDNTIPERVIPGFLQKMILGGNTLEEFFAKVTKDSEIKIPKPPLHDPVRLYSEALWFSFLFALNYHRFDESDCWQESDKVADEVLDLYFRVVGKNQIDSARRLTDMIWKRTMGAVDMTWRGDFTSTVMVLKMDKDKVRELVAPDLDLATTSIYGPNSKYHPVMVFCGEQVNVRPDLYLTQNGYKFGEQTNFLLSGSDQDKYDPSELRKYLRKEDEKEFSSYTNASPSTESSPHGYQYLESFLLVPYVTRGGECFGATTELYLNKSFPTELGRLLGWRKRVADVTAEEQRFEVDYKGTQLLDFEEGDRGQTIDITSDDIGEFGKYKEIFSLPHISKLPTSGVFGRCNTMADFSKAGVIPGRIPPEFTPITCRATLHREFCKLFGSDTSNDTVWDFPDAILDTYAFELRATWVIPPTVRIS